MVLAPKQLHASYRDVRNWEELIDFIYKNGCPKKPYIMTSMFKCTLEQDELEEKYKGLCTKGQMIMDHIYGQISYNCCLVMAFKLKLGHNLNIFFVEIGGATEVENTEHVIRPTNVLPACRVNATCVQLVTIIHWFWKVLKRVEERKERRLVGNRMILV